MIKHIYQGNKPVCGQACVAMLTGTTINEVQKLCGKTGATGAKDLIKALNALGIEAQSSKLISCKGRCRVPMPPNCLVREKTGVNSSHWLLCLNGILYDPASKDGIPLCRGTLTSYLPIKWAGD